MSLVVIRSPRQRSQRVQSTVVSDYLVSQRIQNVQFSNGFGVFGCPTGSELPLTRSPRQLVSVEGSELRILCSVEGSDLPLTHTPRQLAYLVAIVEAARLLLLYYSRA